MKQVALFLSVTLAGFTLLSPLALAQGGPPFRSDDPDTPGNKRWEINIGLIGDRNPSQGSYATPNLDVNYGLGDRIQLKYELPLSVQQLRGDSGHVVAGLGNSLLGMKWRFYEHHAREPDPTRAGETNFALSLYPQLVLNNATRSVGREIVEPGPQLLVPAEANARIGPIRISAELGYWFTNRDVPNSWIRGLIVGHEFGKKTELYLELYDQAYARGIADKPKARESTIGIGGRRTIARDGSVLFIGMMGRSLVTVTPTNGQPSWIAYVGVQFWFSSNKKHSNDETGCLKEMADRSRWRMAE